MNIKRFILKKLQKKGELRASEVVFETGLSRAYINRFFSVLRNENKIILVGKANQAHYILAHKTTALAAKRRILSVHRMMTNKNLSEDVVLDEIKRNSGIFLKIPKNIVKILDYAFTEMLNNAIEHSRSLNIEVFFQRNDRLIRFEIFDRGIGIFINLIKKKKLKNESEAIQDLIKGKQTTDPKKHTGEGIFFTSKIADVLTFQSSNKKLIFDNAIGDIFVKDIKNVKGTKVIFIISLSSNQNLSKIFKEFSDESFEFSKTRVIIKLYRTGVDYISRSQARRVLTGLEKFKEVVLDFKKVDTVGQAFADEVFRVWQAHHLNTKIKYENANDNVVFMINRGLDKIE